MKVSIGNFNKLCLYYELLVNGYQENYRHSVSQKTIEGVGDTHHISLQKVYHLFADQMNNL